MRDIDVIGYEGFFFPRIMKIQGENENEFLYIPTCTESLGIITEVLPASKSDRYGSLWHKQNENEFDITDKAKYYFYKPTEIYNFSKNIKQQIGVLILLGFFMTALFPNKLKYVFATLFVIILLWEYLVRSHHLFNQYEYRMCYYRPNKKEMVFVDDCYQTVTFYCIEDVDEYPELIPDIHGGEISLLCPRNHKDIPTYIFDKDNRDEVNRKRLERSVNWLENELSKVTKVTDQPKEIIRRPPVEEE